jgi:biotin operon repressor
MADGWVKLHRKTTENIELMKDNTAFVVFTKLLLFSNSKGQVGKSGRELAEMVNYNHSTLYKALKRLEEYGQISQTNKHGYTLISILNWDKHQQMGKHFGKQYSTGVNLTISKQFGKRTVNGRETDGKRLTGVARIENKNKESGVPDFEGSGYRKAREIAEAIKARV